jgi:hypothetical protein
MQGGKDISRHLKGFGLAYKKQITEKFSHEEAAQSEASSAMRIFLIFSEKPAEKIKTLTARTTLINIKP